MLKASCLMLEINEFRMSRCENRVKKSTYSAVHIVQYIQRIVRAGGFPAVVGQWHGSSQRCLGFDSRRLPAFSLSSIFTS